MSSLQRLETFVGENPANVHPQLGKFLNWLKVSDASTVQQSRRVWVLDDAGYNFDRNFLADLLKRLNGNFITRSELREGRVNVSPNDALVMIAQMPGGNKLICGEDGGHRDRYSEAYPLFKNNIFFLFNVTPGNNLEMFASKQVPEGSQIQFYQSFEYEPGRYCKIEEMLPSDSAIMQEVTHKMISIFLKKIASGAPNVGVPGKMEAKHLQTRVTTGGCSCLNWFLLAACVGLAVIVFRG